MAAPQPLQISETDCICEQCWEAAMRAVNESLHTAASASDNHPSAASSSGGGNYQGNRLGHSRVCIRCGRSVLRFPSELLMRTNPTARQRQILEHIASTVAPRQLLCLVLAVAADPLPGRVPKVYNALITSNQNLEPSKAYPVYQPVLHDFGFPYQPAVFYGDYPIGNGLQPIPAAPRKDQNEAPPQPPAPAPQNPEEAKPSPESPTALPEPSNVPEEDQQEGQQEGGKATPAPPLPPNTESPIPLNQFGLPSQVLPLGRFNPAYNGFNQIGPFTYSYPSVQFYDPYDPFSLNPYVNFPSLYRPLPNVLEARHPGIPLEAPKGVPISARPAEAPPQPGQNPPPEPNDLNVLNYSSKDPAIPNVPPPPLPQGGLKSDGTE